MMNLFRAISVGGGAGDLRGNDSTILICHVQLCVLAVDWILNILVDNFLQDPLVIMIIFICQALLLIIGLIFYLMASANQAMKEGIHEKLLRHHQLTVGLWALYFSTLVCWYTWTLKRSWPSAGDHFSFTFSGGEYVGKHKLEDEISSTLLSTSTDRTFEPATTISLSSPPEAAWTPGTEKSRLQSYSSGDSENITNATTEEALDVTEAMQSAPLLSQARLFDTMAAAVQSLAKDANNRTLSNHSEVPGNVDESVKDDYYKFFWSPGFISVYVIERSASLLFYTAYILGTMHIVNAHFLDKQTLQSREMKTDDNQRLGIDSRNDASQNKKNHEKDVYVESDSNLDDNFIRQLEDQDGDPFDNEQYHYQYKLNANKTSGLLGRDYDSENLQTETSSETDEGYSAKRPKKHGKNKLKNDTAQMVPQTKGALKNMMIASKFRKGSGQSVKKPAEWFESSEDIDGIPNLSKVRAFEDNRNFLIETKLAPVTTSSSIDTMATGSTDELLVAQVYTREDKNFSRTQAFRNDYGQSEENLYSHTH